MGRRCNLVAVEDGVGLFKNLNLLHGMEMLQTAVAFVLTDLSFNFLLEQLSIVEDLLARNLKRRENHAW